MADVWTNMQDCTYMYHVCLYQSFPLQAPPHWSQDVFEEQTSMLASLWTWPPSVLHEWDWVLLPSAPRLWGIHTNIQVMTQHSSLWHEHHSATYNEVWWVWSSPNCPIMSWWSHLFVYPIRSTLVRSEVLWLMRLRVLLSASYINDPRSRSWSLCFRRASNLYLLPST